MNKRLYRMAVFALVVEHGSFAGAARELDRAPSVVSTLVRDLEQDVGACVLHRSTRRLALTDSGEQLLPHCQAVLEALRSSEQIVQRMRDVVQGRLHLSAPTSLLDSLVVPTLRKLLDAHPAIEAECTLSDSRDDLEDGSVDLAVRVGPLTELSHRARRIGSLREVRVDLPGSPDRAIVLPWQDASSGDILRVSSVVLAKAAVLAGLGWAVLPELCLGERASDGTLRARAQRAAVPIYAVHAFGSHAPPQVRATLKILVQVAKSTMA